MGWDGAGRSIGRHPFDKYPMAHRSVQLSLWRLLLSHHAGLVVVVERRLGTQALAVVGGAPCRWLSLSSCQRGSDCTGARGIRPRYPRQRMAPPDRLDSNKFAPVDAANVRVPGPDANGVRNLPALGGPG